MKALEKVPDHRQASGKRHPLAAILSFMCCGMLCGAKSRLAIFEWGRAHQPWCLEVFGFKQRTPCVNTLYWVLKDLDVVAFEAALRDWVEVYTGEAMELEPIAIDGKTVRGAKQQNLPGVHLLSAFARRSGTVLAKSRCWCQRKRDCPSVTLARTLKSQRQSGHR